jgi:uncharacterized membrane protein
MSSTKVKFTLLFLSLGMLSACASHAAQSAVSSVSQPIKEVPTNISSPGAQATPAAQAALGTVSFNDDILPILENSCMNCHGQQRIEEGLSLRTYSDMMAGSQNGAVVVPGNAANSLLAQLVSNQKMPKRGPKLTSSQVQLIIDWINQGAQDN